MVEIIFLFLKKHSRLKFPISNLALLYHLTESLNSKIENSEKVDGSATLAPTV